MFCHFKHRFYCKIYFSEWRLLADLTSLPETSHETNFTRFSCRNRNSLNSHQLKESLDDPHNGIFSIFGRQKKALTGRKHLPVLSTQRGQLTQEPKLQTRRKRLFNLPFQHELNHALETLKKEEKKISAALPSQQKLNQALKSMTRQKLSSSLPFQNLNQKLEKLVKIIFSSGLPFEQCIVSEILKTSVKLKCFSVLLFQKGLINQLPQNMIRQKRFSDLALEQCLVNEILKILMRQKCFSHLPLKKGLKSQVSKIIRAQKLLSNLSFEQCLISGVTKDLTIQKFLSVFPLLEGPINQVLKILIKFFSDLQFKKCQ